jgi:U3 small nucleolar RNA-associated protein 12
LIHLPQGELKAVFLLQNNLVELYSLNVSLPAPQPVRTSRITIGGHRSDVRTLSFSSDNIAVLSAAADSIKIWNRFVKWCFL